MRQRAEIARGDSSRIRAVAELERDCIPGGWSEKAFEDFLGNENSVMFLLLLEDEPIGFVNGSFILDEAELLNIAVAEKFRGNGFASMLLDRFKSELQQKGVKVIYLEVREGNAAARRFYEKHGFVQNGLRKNYYTTPPDNAVLMRGELL